MLLILLLVVCISLIVVSTVKLKLHPFLALVFAAISFGLLSGMELSAVVGSINDGFADTLSRIGIIIVAGVVIGTFLERSGGAFAIAEKVLRIVGSKRVPLAMAIIGYIVSIPVFADSGFVILTPLNRAIAKRAGISLAGGAVALAAGLTATHCLVPPTPGPIAAAGIVGADLGMVIVFGLVVSLAAVAVACMFATRFASRVFIDPNPELSSADVQAKLKDAPSVSRSLIPILFPMLLIVLKSIARLPSRPLGDGRLSSVIGFVGEPVIALIIGILLAFRLPRRFDKQMLSATGWVGQALIDSALIIMITGAGGAFGMVLRNSQIADMLSKSLSQTNLGILLPFIIAASLKTAQGSSTVALITTASLITPLMPALGFESSLAKALVVTSISSGSMVVSHANDSFFWVVTQMSRMDVQTGYRLHTVVTFIMGVISILIVWLASLILL